MVVEAFLLAFAIEIGGYKEFCYENPEKCAAPTILYAPDDYMTKAKGGHVLAARSPDVIVIADRYKPRHPDHDSIVVHETVHVLQLRSQRYRGTTICHKAARENEAYKTQRAYLMRHGLDFQRGMYVPNDLLRKCNLARKAGLVK